MDDDFVLGAGFGPEPAAVVVDVVAVYAVDAASLIASRRFEGVGVCIAVQVNGGVSGLDASVVFVHVIDAPIVLVVAGKVVLGLDVVVCENLLVFHPHFLKAGHQLAVLVEGIDITADGLYLADSQIPVACRIEPIAGAVRIAFGVHVLVGNGLEPACPQGAVFLQCSSPSS